MHTAPDRLTDMLTRLKLTAVRDQLDGLLDEAGRQEETVTPLDQRRKQRNESDMNSTRQPKTAAALLSAI